MSQLIIPEERAPIGFPISPLKLVVMHVATFGVYDLYWAYKNFANLTYPGPNKFGWLIYSLFIPISLHGLLKRFNELAAHFGQDIKLRQNSLAWLFFSLHIVSNIALRGDNNGALNFLPEVFVVAPLILAQRKINQINRNARPDIVIDGKFNIANIIGIVLGGMLWFLLIYGSFLPPVPAE